MKIALILYFFIIAMSAQSHFLTEQKSYKRVRTAIAEKEQLINEQLKNQSIELDKLNILIVTYKQESELVIYVKKKTDLKYTELVTYNICSKSGQLGPKRKQGDYQVPEGLYFIDRFNPVSSYYLSLGINYPNLADKRKSNAQDLGGDIFIHGSCVTIGCLPMTDDKIKEIYLYAIHAKNNGQKKIPVYMFPFKMNSQNFKAFVEEYDGNTDLIDFWTILKKGYDIFQKDKQELDFSVDSQGDYLFH